MNFEGGETTAVLRSVVARVREQNLTFLAGSLAYNAFVSLIPLLLLVLLVVGTVGNEAFAVRVTGLTESYLTHGAQEEISSAIDNAGGRVGISVTGVVILLWGALKLFRGLDTAFAEVYETERGSDLLKQIRDGVVAMLAIVLSVTALILAGSAFAYLQLPLLHLLNPLFLLVGLSVAFLPMYYVFPDVEMSVREALPGAVVAAGGWAVLEVGFQVYASFAGRYEAYGVIGGILLLLTWLYFGGLVLLVGAAVNAVIRERALGRLDAASEASDGDDAGTQPDAGTRPDAGVTVVDPSSGTAGAGDAAAGTGDAGGSVAGAAEAGATAPRGTTATTDATDATPATAGSDAGRGARGRPVRNIAAAFAVGVVVGLVTVVAAALRLAR